MLPPIQPANSFAGGLSEAGAALLGLRPGIAVSTGAADSVCAAYAMAGLDPRVVSVSFGSSAVIIGADERLRLDPSARYLVTPHVDDNWYGREMDLLASGTGYRWLSELFGWQDGQIDSYAVDSAPGARGLCFAPYLAGGEQGALWNPRLQGAIFGLNLRHSPSDIARAYLEGVFYEVQPLRGCAGGNRAGRVGPSQRQYRALAEQQSRCWRTSSIASWSRCRTNRPRRSAPHCSRAGSAMAASAHGVRPSPSPRTTRPNRPIAQQYAALYRDYVERAARCE